MAPLLLAAVLTLAAAAPAPTPEATPREALREIGHVHAVTPFCQSFESHFNATARTMVQNDEELSYVGFTLGNVAAHFKALGGELLLYTDRINLMHYADQLFKAIPGLQDEINKLRRSAELTKDPEQAKATREAAAQLQKSLDKEKQLALDTMGLVQALTTMQLGSDGGFTVDTTGGSANQGQPYNGPAASTEFQGSASSNSLAQQQLPEVERDLRNYIQYDKQQDRIADAESHAVGTAQTVADRCDGAGLTTP